MTISDGRAVPPRKHVGDDPVCSCGRGDAGQVVEARGEPGEIRGAGCRQAVLVLRERPAVPRAPRVEEEGIQVIALCDLTTHL